MEREEIKREFAARDDKHKLLMLLNVMFDLTIVARDVATSQQVVEKCNSLFGISEIDHKILSYVIAKLVGGEHYPDDLIIDIVTDQFIGHGLATHLSHVWDRAIAKSKIS